LKLSDGDDGYINAWGGNPPLGAGGINMYDWGMVESDKLRLVVLDSCSGLANLNLVRAFGVFSCTDYPQFAVGWSDTAYAHIFFTDVGYGAVMTAFWAKLSSLPLRQSYDDAKKDFKKFYPPKNQHFDYLREAQDPDLDFKLSISPQWVPDADTWKIYLDGVD
jgi:hypothetical protein